MTFVKHRPGPLWALGIAPLVVMLAMQQDAILQYMTYADLYNVKGLGS